MRRRPLLLAALAAPAGAVSPRATLVFPRDHGAHPDVRIEWWYATGFVGPMDDPRLGFQLTFFRNRTGLAADLRSRFAPRQLLFVHAAVTDLAARRHHHAQRIARWSGEDDAGPARASLNGTDVQIGRWRLRDEGKHYAAQLDDEAFALDLRLARRQPLLLQGDKGYSRKGPDPSQASHYVTEPQLGVTGQIRIAGRSTDVQGSAWLDHEWSDQLLHPDAVGWDWIGINLADGSALTAFRLRRANGSALWAGGSWRAPGHAVRIFDADAVRFSPGRVWTSAATEARYPVQWQVETPAGTFGVDALMDAQELDSRASTGTVYWEGLCALTDGQGRRIGLGYLEMTGYAGRLRL